MELKASKTFVVNTIRDGEPGAPGQPGAAGKNGKWYDFAGEWGTGEGQISSVTNTTNIGYYVKYGENFYMNIAPDGIANATTPGTDVFKWEIMQADRQFYIAKAFFGDYAQFGSGIINGDWMISRVAREDSPSESYTDFDSGYPAEVHGNNFIPMYALDLRTGKLYANDVNLTGTINATEGSIGGFTISDNYIASDTIDIDSNENFVRAYSGPNKRVFAELKGGKGFGIGSIPTSGGISYSNEINSDGSGSLANGNIVWDSDGTITASNSFVDSIMNVLANYMGDSTSNEIGITPYSITFKDDVNEIRSSFSANALVIDSDSRGTTITVKDTMITFAENGDVAGRIQMVDYQGNLGLKFSASDSIEFDSPISMGDNKITFDSGSISYTSAGLEVNASANIYLNQDVSLKAADDTEGNYWDLKASEITAMNGFKTGADAGITQNVDLSNGKTLVIKGGIITNVIQNS